jgi:hypothetical protein
VLSDDLFLILETQLQLLDRQLFGKRCGADTLRLTAVL